MRKCLCTWTEPETFWYRRNERFVQMILFIYVGGCMPVYEKNLKSPVRTKKLSTKKLYEEFGGPVSFKFSRVITFVQKGQICSSFWANFWRDKVLKTFYEWCMIFGVDRILPKSTYPLKFEQVILDLCSKVIYPLSALDIPLISYAKVWKSAGT